MFFGGGSSSNTHNHDKQDGVINVGVSPLHSAIVLAGFAACAALGNYLLRPAWGTWTRPNAFWLGVYLGAADQYNVPQS